MGNRKRGPIINEYNFKEGIQKLLTTMKKLDTYFKELEWLHKDGAE